MKLKNRTLAVVLALGAAAMLTSGGAEAATAANGDILLGFRATGGTGSTKNLVVNLGPATALENATGTVNLGNLGTDLANTYGTDWKTRNDLFWGIAGTVGNSAIGGTPAKTVYGSRAVPSAWLRQNNATHGAVTNKMIGMMSAFNGSPSTGLVTAGAVLQTNTSTNSWSSYQPGGTLANSGPAPGTSFAFFNPTVEASLAAGPVLHVYRVKPAVSGADIDKPGDYLGAVFIEPAGRLVFNPSGSQARLSMSAPVYSVLQGDASATVEVRRVPGTAAGAADATSVQLSTANGTDSSLPPFKAAKSGTDYTTLSTTVNFAANEFVKTVNVTLIPVLAASPNKRFLVNLSSPAANAQVGEGSSTVQIISDTAESPTVAIQVPAGITGSNVLPLIASGKSGSSIGVDRVMVSLNGAPAVAAILGTATSATNVPWSVSLEPANGINTLVATVYDLAGNSSSVRRRFSFERRYVLGITRSVPVAVTATPDAAGAVTMTASPSTKATTLPTTANINPVSSSVLPGTSVTLKAASKTGYVFSHWSGLPAGASVQGNVVTFSMPSANTAVTASFVVNAFAGGSGQAAGTFVGLLHPVGGATSSNSTEGFISGTLTSGTGAFDGKLFIDGKTTSFSVVFFGNGDGFFKSGTTLAPNLSLGGDKSFDVSYSAGQIQATLSSVAVGSSAGILQRGIYSSASKVPAQLLNAVGKGNYTLGFPSKVQVPSKPSADYPQGDGFATLTLSDTGVVSLTATLADGSKATASSVLVSGNVCPLFAQLATPGSTTLKGGSIGGSLQFDNSQPDTDVSGVDFLWFRPAVTESTPAVAATDLYTSGWPDGIKVNAVGALYNSALTVQDSLGAPGSASGNTDLVFANLKNTPINVITRSFSPKILGNTITVLPVGTTSYTLSVTTSSGLFSGKVTASASGDSKPGFNGVLIQKGGNKGGFGFFISNLAADRDPQSGGVSLTAK
jgi:hypothetical protein